MVAGGKLCATAPPQLDLRVIPSHLTRWWRGAAMSFEDDVCFSQLLLIGCSGLARCDPKQCASNCPLRPQAVVGSRFRLIVTRRAAASLGAMRPIAVNAVHRRGTTQQKLQRSLEQKLANMFVHTSTDFIANAFTTYLLLKIDTFANNLVNARVNTNMIHTTSAPRSIKWF